MVDFLVAIDVNPDLTQFVTFDIFFPTPLGPVTSQTGLLIAVTADPNATLGIREQQQLRHDDCTL